MKINKEKLKVFKTITKNFVLTGTLTAVVLTSPMFKVNVKATNDINVNNYELSEDGSTLLLDGANDLSILNNVFPYFELRIENSTINNPKELQNVTFDSLVLVNCSINGNLELSSSITELTIENTKFNSSNALNSIQNINKITFSDCEFDNLEIISKLNNVTNLSFSNCTIGSLRGIENLTQLENLDFYAVGIENIDELNKLENLNTLSLLYTHVKSLEPLKNLNISYLDVSDSVNIKDFKVIKTLPNLTDFFAYNCEMSTDKEIIEYLKTNNISSNLSSKSLAIKDAIYSISKKINHNATTTDEKIENIVQYVIDTMTYAEEIAMDDELLLETNNNALENALNGSGVCKSYTALTTALMRSEGISAYEILGDGHIWNLVKLGDEYYWLDSTFIECTETTDITVCEDYMTQSEAFTEYNNPWYIPSSWYNKINNIKPVEYTIDNNESINKETIKKEEIVNIINTKSLSGASLIGILSALGFAYTAKKANKYKKENKQAKNKIK